MEKITLLGAQQNRLFPQKINRVLFIYLFHFFKRFVLFQLLQLCYYLGLAHVNFYKLSERCCQQVGDKLHDLPDTTG